MAEKEEKVEETAKTTKELYGEELPKEVLESGIGVGFVSQTRASGISAGIAGEEDERAKPLAESQDPEAEAKASIKEEKEIEEARKG